MGNTTKAIMIGVALFIVIGLITAVVLVTTIGTDTMRNQDKNLQGVSESVATQIIDNYNNRDLTGANVISAIKKFYNKENFLLVVNNNGTEYMYSTKKTSDGSNIDINGTKAEFSGSLIDNEPDISNLTNSIKAQAKYHSYIIYNNNEDVVLGIYFKKK